MVGRARFSKSGGKNQREANFMNLFANFNEAVTLMMTPGGRPDGSGGEEGGEKEEEEEEEGEEEGEEEEEGEGDAEKKNTGKEGRWYSITKREMAWPRHCGSEQP